MGNFIAVFDDRYLAISSHELSRAMTSSSKCSFFLCFFQICFWIIGSSTLHGEQDVEKKFIKTILPFRSDSLIFFPSLSWISKSGALYLFVSRPLSCAYELPAKKAIISKVMNGRSFFIFWGWSFTFRGLAPDILLSGQSCSDGEGPSLCWWLC